MKKNYRILKVERYHESDIFRVQYRILFLPWFTVREPSGSVFKRGNQVDYGSYREVLSAILKLEMKPKPRDRVTVVSNHNNNPLSGRS